MFGAAAVSLAGIGHALANPTLLFDLKTGQVLQHEEAFQRWHPASLTKLMTAYVTFRAIQAGELELTSPIRMSKVSAAEPPSKMGFKPGSEMTLDNALKMMLIKSANDVAAAIAENVGGTIPTFVNRMNSEAARIGMSGSHFTNPNGLHSPDQYTTARDLAVLVTAIRSEFPEYNGYYKIEGLKSGKTVMRTYNKLIGRFDGADGMKTGFVCASGFNLIGTATRDGQTLGAIVLGATLQKDRAEIAAEMLSNGFAKTSAAGADTIYTMQPYGEGRDEAVNMRETICGKAPVKKKPDVTAKATIADAKALAADAGATGSEATTVASEASEGETLKASSFLGEVNKQPALIAVGLGGATGPIPAGRAAIGEIDYSDVPIPTWRPDYAPESLKAAQGDTSAGG